MPDSPRSRLAAARDAVAAVAGAILGIAPHVLHHIGLIAGTAFVSGAGGNALFYVIGLVLSVPMLRRLHRRFGTWVAPVLAVVAFTAVFLLSALVVGPAITGEGTPAPPTPVPSEQHSEHHS